MLVRIKSNRFGEKWEIGSIVGMDEEAARVPLEKGEVELVDSVQDEFVCDVCKKVCKNRLGLNAHRRTHK